MSSTIILFISILAQISSRIAAKHFIASDFNPRYKAYLLILSCVAAAQIARKLCCCVATMRLRVCANKYINPINIVASMNKKGKDGMRPKQKIVNTLVHNLTWSHFRTIIQVADPKAKDWYAREASEQMWSVRPLNRNATFCS